MRRPTLRRRLTILTALAVAVGVVGVTVTAWLLLRVQLRDEVQADLFQQAGNLAEHVDPTKLQSPPSWVKPDLSTLFGVVYPNGGSRRPVFQSPKLPVTGVDVAVALGDSGPVLRDVYVDRVHYLMLTTHSVRGDAVQLADDLTDVDTTLTDFGVLLGVTDAIGIVVAAALGYGFTVAGLRPVYRVAAAAAHVAETQDLATAVPISPQEIAEVASVADSMNQMLTALGLARDAQRQLIEDANHELATPLTSLRTNVDLLLRAERNPDRTLEPEDRVRLLTDIEAQMRELDHLIEEIVELAKDPGSAEEPTEIDLAEVTRAAVHRARTRTPDAIFELTDESVMVLGQRLGLERAVLNLLDNAAKWSPAGEPVEVVVRRWQGLAEVVVSDRGPGVPIEDLERVFERFHRTTEARAMPGSGLGLAIVRQITLANGGRSWIARRAGGGTEAHIELPSSPARVRE
ncbi:MAG TPA: HAMP domain-containing sensor histidine kinase [Pseudonocardiaceae bacterium]|jgi:two-component system sensor histidine kinase MprB|nr:HAMP domain-containing sensor histidine kinase [Pseudonocardiaceae bacterium]